ncbi:dynein regulatory complex protein 9 [Perognathus longimembris pacificus]|uniref:dynein regulatory complex protein 9 n=1 Tax=Perognathus longimembris pacificus TaxID=214514 RepID=UPI002019B560|nr:dynein regulatory complex protein 9 [Perognathus longimembris pacificus]
MGDHRLQATSSDFPPKSWPSELVMVTGEPPTAVEIEEIGYEDVVEETIIPEVIEPLCLIEMLRISSILEDTIDQLSILNYIMPIQYERKQSVSEPYSGRAKSSMVPSTGKIPAPLSSKGRPALPELRGGGQPPSEPRKVQEPFFKTPTRQTIMTVEAMRKIQMDRQYLSDVIANTRQELENSSTFTHLQEALSKERNEKLHFYEAIAREEKGKKQIRSLQRQVMNVKKERQAEVQSRNEYISHLKDQLQEMKAKTNLENQYMKKNTELQISQTQRKCNRTEELLMEEIEKLRMKTEEENRTHMEIEIFLKKEQQKLEEKLEYWMEKYDKDTEMKQNELTALQTAKATDLAHLQELAKMIREYEQVIIEDRIEKEKTRKKIEQDDLELKSIIKLQAWWRGTVVRREIGSFKMPKKEKDDGKDVKGKGKDKKDKWKGKKK